MITGVKEIVEVGCLIPGINEVGGSVEITVTSDEIGIEQLKEFIDRYDHSTLSTIVNINTQSKRFHIYKGELRKTFIETFACSFLSTFWQTFGRNVCADVTMNINGKIVKFNTEKDTIE
jgi:hypothetical protein